MGALARIGFLLEKSERIYGNYHKPGNSFVSKPKFRIVQPTVQRGALRKRQRKPPRKIRLPFKKRRPQSKVNSSLT